MKDDKKQSTSKEKKTKIKEPKLTAAERRRIQREKRKAESDGDERFSAFETHEIREPKKRYSPTDQSRFSNFDVDKTKREEKDDYFERIYGSDSKNKFGASHQRAKEKKNEEKKENHVYREKPIRNKELTKSQRKFRTALSYVIVFAVVAVLSVILCLTVIFKTTDVLVEGNSTPYSDEEIVETSGLGGSENIFMSRKKLAVKKIVEKYPYIENAEVSIRIPGTQIITIEAAVPSFQVAVSDGFAVVSAKNRVLEISGNQRSNIPLLKGLKVTSTGVGEYISFEKSTTQQVLNEVINNINDNKVPNIYGIDISNSANIKLNYDNRITILLGVPEDVGYKLRTAMAIINNELSSADKGDLDVSLANSDRKSSYFTPVYSNTVDINDQSTASSQAAQSGTNSIVNADEYLNRNNSSDSASNAEEEYNYIEDIIDEEAEEEQLW